MKKLLFLSLAAAFTFNANAQKKIKVVEANETIGTGSNNALVITLYEASVSDVEKEWKSLMKDFNAKVSSSKGQMFADNALIKSMGANTMDVYSIVQDNKDGSLKLVVGFDLGGAYLSSSQHGAQFAEAKKIMHDFAVKTTKAAIGSQLKEAQKQQKDLEKTQADLVEDKADLEKDIESYKEKIKKAEADIQVNLKNQETKKAEIETQKKVVTAIDAKLKAVE